MICGNAAGQTAVDSRRPAAGRFGRVHHRTSDRGTSAQSSNAAGPGAVCRTGAPPLGARSSARATGRGNVPAGREGVTRVGPGRSVDNGFRSTRSQRVPGRPEGRRAPIRSVGRRPPTRSADSTPRYRPTAPSRRPRSLWWTPAYGHEGAAVNDGDGTRGEPGEAVRPARHGLGDHPDLQRGGEHQADRRPGARRRARGARPRRRRQQPRRHRQARRRAGRRATTTSTSCTARARKASAPPTSRASAGASSTATASWSRWTPTARTSPRNCPGCSPPSRAPTWSSARAGCPAAASSTGPSPASSSPAAAALYSRLAARTCRSGTSPAATAPSARETLEGLGLDEVASQGYCFQVDLARRAVKAGYHVVEVPDHLRRARAAATPR